GWVDRARLALEAADGTPPPLDDPTGALWFFLVVSQANRQLTAGQLDAAERTVLDIHHMLQRHPESAQQLKRLAVTYHQLGMVAQQRGHLDEAQQWYLKSLTITEELGDRPGMAISYHQLGMVAQDRGHLDEAQQWYLKSLTIKEELGNQPGMAHTFGQLGLLAEARGHPEQALDWTIRCVALFDEFPHPATGPGPANLARLTAHLGIDTLERCWRRVTGQPLPQVVRDVIASDPPDHAA
ncbi:MAG: tetratricopeptide repeat protein, partial [Actinomycetes bacterium]